jgi:hypothetical protein
MATSALAKFCTSCGDAVGPGNRFCTGCGKPLAEPLDHADTIGEKADPSAQHDAAFAAQPPDGPGENERAGDVKTGSSVDGASPSDWASATDQLDLFRYHDLTTRLAAFSTDGGALLRGDDEDLQISDAEPLYGPGEEELARIAGAVELVGSRSIPDVNADASLGLVAKGAGLLVITNKRAIVMFQHPGTTQLGQLNDSEVHTFVLPWDLVDSISMPARKSFADRIAGARTIEIYALMIASVLKIMPVARQLKDGQTGKLHEEEAMALLVRAAAAHRLSVSPATDRSRLRTLLDGSFPITDGELVANITDEQTSGVPAHLVGRLIERSHTPS